MLEIIFEQVEDAKRFRALMPASLIKIEDNHLQNEDLHIVKSSKNTWMTTVKQAFVQFLETVKQTDWLRWILQKKFFYEDEHEQEQILDIAISVLEGNRKELLSLVGIREQDIMITEAVEQLFAEKVSFSFDSFVRFRLRSYVNHLEKLIEVSIDEYKMEQEYQMFIQMLREFLAGRPSLKDKLHVVIQDSVYFYDEHFYEMKRKELVDLVDRKLLFNHPVYIDSIAIAPLLSIAPQEIYLYTDDPEQPLVRTLAKIFEERIVLSSLKSFVRADQDAIK